MGIRNTLATKQDGIAITDIVDLKKCVAVVENKLIQFNIENKNNYILWFNALKNEGIVNGEYDNRTWNAIGDKYNLEFAFGDFEYDLHIYESLKAYCVLRLYHHRIGADSVKAELNYIKKVISITQNFSEDLIVELDKALEKYKEITVRNILISISYYLVFAKVQSIDSYSDYLLNRDEWDADLNCIRILPPITSIICFENKLMEYFKSNLVSIDDKMKFYPVYLWWNITGVIPLRISEFLRIKRNCLSIDSRNRYYLEINRKKKKPNPLSKKSAIPNIDKIEITKELYDEIEKYINIAEIESEKYLFPLSLNIKYSDGGTSVEKNSTFKDRINYHHMRNLLGKFYKDVISKDYVCLNSKDEITEENQNVAIVKLRLGDTRHLAFCSMLLQGFNPLTIATIGGHKALSTQMSYHGHLEELIECHTYLLAKTLKKEVSIVNFRENQLSSRELALLSFRNEGKQTMKVKGGWCYSSNFPNECACVSCFRCQYFKLDLNGFTEELQNELDDTIIEADNEINNKLTLLKRYILAPIKELSTKMLDSEIKSKSVGLRKTLEQKARLLAIKDKIMEV
ncbi:hypothetical protein BH721_03890 [Clostridium baratii]|uniref:site-specific integrase n=1 Tax=Clostridium baratii TaxID=1561 RepID=UPI0009A45E23|nr:site-specific integrase [Clostridium baratii]OPF52405.1 hypothetical protein A1M12_10095 [Clostridium baratii]OPF55855.1 hypothetical protein BH721_03890 [Clostridium baratii]OPF56764.1 hypothetical protein BH724_09535 [Clostridium baratii]OPF59763.1 hypothetical protein BH725_04035 [Clostridium baratii]